MPGISFDTVSMLIGDIYSAAADDQQWQQVVQRISDMFDCSRVCVTGLDDSGIDAVSTVEDGDFNSENSLVAHLRDPMMAAAFAAPVGLAFSRRQITSEAAFRRRELWTDWYRDRDLAEGLACILHVDGGRNLSVHAHRGEGQAEFDDDELKVFQHLSGHMVRAGQMNRKMKQVTAYAELFTRLPIGLVQLDRKGRATVVNTEAERLLSMANSPLAIRNGQLICFDKSAGADLMAKLSALANGEIRGEITAVLTGAEQPEPTARPTIVVSATRFGDSASAGIGMPGPVMVVLRDLAIERSSTFGRHLQDLFGLTPAESGLCIALAAGLPLKDAAAEADITFKTARTYLERIFAKTNTRQQSQLVALVKSSRPLF